MYYLKKRVLQEAYAESVKVFAFVYVLFFDWWGKILEKNELPKKNRLFPIKANETS